MASDDPTDGAEQDSGTERELVAILEELDAIRAWEVLPRALQLRWLDWISSGWDTPRIRMYKTANSLLKGKPEPPKFSRVKALVSAYFDDWFW